MNSCRDIKSRPERGAEQKMATDAVMDLSFFTSSNFSPSLSDWNHMARVWDKNEHGSRI